jgi:hypothetical protein
MRTRTSNASPLSRGVLRIRLAILGTVFEKTHTPIVAA